MIPYIIFYVEVTLVGWEHKRAPSVAFQKPLDNFRYSFRKKKKYFTHIFANFKKKDFILFFIVISTPSVGLELTTLRSGVAYSFG